MKYPKRSQTSTRNADTGFDIGLITKQASSPVVT